MTDQPAPTRNVMDGLLGQTYWLILSKPTAGTSVADIEKHAPDHVRWLLELERQHLLFASGPLVAGPEVSPGAGMSLLRAEDEAEARRVASSDPFVRADLRTFEVYLWRLNEGSVSLRVSLGTGTYQWG